MGRTVNRRRAPSHAALAASALLVLILAACGGDAADPGDAADDQAAGGSDTTVADGGSDATNGSNDAGGAATATLTVGDDVYTWTAEDMTVCEINGVFGPANADFGVPPSQGGEGPWVQFIDRGDGGINFSAVIDGEEYSGTGSGEADEIRSDGFSYTGSMSRSGENVEVELEVGC